MRRTLSGYVQRCSPATAGFISGSAMIVALLAYHACADGHLTSLPHLGTCHCWITGVAGLLVGTLAAGVTLLAHALLKPVIHAIVQALRVIPPAVELAARLSHDFRVACTSQPLALCCASRAPPIAH